MCSASHPDCWKVKESRKETKYKSRRIFVQTFTTTYHKICIYEVIPGASQKKSGPCAKFWTYFGPFLALWFGSGPSLESWTVVVPLLTLMRSRRSKVNDFAALLRGLGRTHDTTVKRNRRLTKRQAGVWTLIFQPCSFGSGTTDCKNGLGTTGLGSCCCCSQSRFSLHNCQKCSRRGMRTTVIE